MDYTKKHWVIVTLLLVALFCLVGCGDVPPEEEIPVGEDALMRDSVVYYEQEDGYLVPVMVQAAWSSDIAETLVSQLTTSETAFELEEAGLTGLLPSDTQVNVSLEDATATVSLESASLADVEKDKAKNIVSAIVNTLGQFPAIEQVQFQVNGATDVFGEVDISEAFSSVDLNPAYANDEGYTPLTVYYKTVDSGLLTPVTKYAANLTPEVLVKALVREPKDTDALMSLFPEGTQVLGVDLADDGVLTVDFSKELLSVSESKEKEEKLLTGIILTCQQLEGVEQVNITVEGEPYTGPLEATMAQAVFGNELAGDFDSLTTTQTDDLEMLDTTSMTEVLE